MNNGGDPWRPFKEVVQSPWHYAGAWKQKTGGKVVGHLLPDVPEELIHAAGALPVAVEGAGVQVSRAQAHIPGYTCSHAMGSLEMKLRGDLDVLDGMVIPYVCDTTRNFFHIWNHCFPGMTNEFLRLPKRIAHKEAGIYLRAEFARLFESMKKLTGTEAGTRELAASVSLYNRSRSRLREAHMRHRQNPRLWSLEKVQTMMAAALRTSREEHLTWMDALPWDEAGNGGSIPGIRVYVRGKVWDPPGILPILDALGMIVAGDEMVTGFRGIQFDGDENLDPLESLVQRHLSTIPYAGYHIDPEQMVERFLDRVRDSKALGVIFLNPKFCEAAAFDTPDLQAALVKEQIPSLVLETSARGVSPEQIRLRLEAFSEMLAGELP